MSNKCIFFDLDGVLIDAKEWHFKALNSALIDCGLPAISIHDHLNRFDGLPTKEKLRILYSDSVSTDTLKKISSLKKEYTHDALAKTDVFSEELFNALKNLKEDGFKMACCSNSIRDFVDLSLKKLGVFDFFDLVVSNQDVENPKPNPEMYQKAASFFGIGPDDCIVVEDNLKGIQAALSAGLRVFVVRGPKDITERIGHLV